MAERLKIYACSGIGETAKTGKQFWTDGTNTVSNTQAINTILIRINALYARLGGMDKEEKIAALNNIDWLCVALDAAKRFKEDNTKLYHAGEVISVMAQDGSFEYDSLNEDERAAHLEELLAKAESMYGDETIQSEDADFMDDWQKQIVDRNIVFLSEKQQTSTKKVLKKAVAGIGKINPNWQESDDISVYLNNASDYFLYLFFTKDQQEKLPENIKNKIRCQKRTYNYCKAYFVGIYGTEQDMVDVIRTSIYEDFKQEPESLCAAIASGQKIEGVGAITTAIVIGAAEFLKILTIVAGVVVAIVTAICDCIYKSNVEKYGSLNKAIIEGGVPGPEDYDGNGNINPVKKNNWVLWLLGGAAVVALLKN